MAKSNVPTFQADPFYQQSQNFMFPYGTNILQGNIPDYYKSIGMSGSPEFEKMLGLTNKSIMDASAESAAAGGIARSGVAPAAASGAIASTDASLRYQDLLTANQGKEYLMGIGSNMVGQVGSNALSNQGQLNNFNLSAAKMKMDEQSQNQSMWSSILSSGIGALGTIGGMAMLGPAGAGMGGMLGKLFGSAAPQAGSVGGASGMGLDFASSFGKGI